MWTLVAMETEGHTLTPEQIEGRNARYTGDLISLRVGDEVRRQGIVTLLPGRSPKAINTWDLDGPFEDQTVPGIYELSPDGKTLKLCFTRPGEDRPKKFSTKAGTGFLFVVYQKKVEPK
ncbi:MAG: TIGR03067 domain-containing protein [Isosphaeraceae bacterium]